jgi:hypothetical protein
MPLTDFPARAIFTDDGMLTGQAARFVASVVRAINGGGVPTAVSLTASPLTYTAVGNGRLAIVGGTVSGLSFKRGSVSVSLGTTNRLIPLSAGDQITLTYTGTPVLTWIPA